MLAAAVRVTGDIDLAEECVQDAYARALATWGTGGIPEKPGAWLTTVARRRAIDLARRDSVRERTLPLLVEPVATEFGGSDSPEIIDDRLRLIFTCCHPAIGSDAQVALTLRLLCGLTTAEVARAFLVSESTMAARITRAKKKIAMARIPFRVPPVTELPSRIDAVLTVVHVLFSTGHTAPAGADLIRRDLVERSLDLARVLRSSPPRQCGRRRPAGPHPPHGRTAAEQTGRRRASGAAPGSGSHPLGPRRHRRGDCPRARSAGAATPGSFRPHGRYRRRARAGLVMGGDRLDRDRRDLRPPRGHLALTCRRPQPRRRRRPGGGARSGTRRAGQARRRTAPGDVQLFCRRRGPISFDSWDEAATRAWRTKRHCFSVGMRWNGPSFWTVSGSWSTDARG